MRPIPYWLIIRSIHANSATRKVLFVRQRTQPGLSHYDHDCVDGPFPTLPLAKAAKAMWLSP